MRASVLGLVLVLAASTAVAGERRCVGRFQAGSATIHEWGPSGGWGEARVGRSFADDLLAADVGLAFSSADEGYLSLTAGLEALPFPRAVVSPFARVEAGVLAEPEFGGYVAGVGGGLSIRLNDRLSLRGGASWGVHGDVEGPVVYYGGFQLRW
jgi:hypothetical protein